MFSKAHRTVPQSAIAVVLAAALCSAVPTPTLAKPVAELTDFDGPLTVDRLAAHFGSRVKVDSFLCRLPLTAALRQPAEYDCRLWLVEDVLSFGGMIRFAAVSYRALPSGSVQERNLTSSGDCNKLLRDYFTIHSYVFNDVKHTVTGAVLTTTNVVGSLSAIKKLSGGQSASVSLRYEGNACELLYSIKSS